MYEPKPIKPRTQKLSSPQFPEIPSKNNRKAFEQEIRDQLHLISQNDEHIQTTLYMKFKYDNLLGSQTVKKKQKQNIWDEELTDWAACQWKNNKQECKPKRETSAVWKKSLTVGIKGSDVLDEGHAIINEQQLSHRYTFLNQHSWRNNSEIIRPSKDKNPTKILLNLSLPKKVPSLFRNSFVSKESDPKVESVLPSSLERPAPSLPKYNDAKARRNYITPYNYLRHNSNLKQKILSNLKTVLAPKQDAISIQQNPEKCSQNINWNLNESLKNLQQQLKSCRKNVGIPKKKIKRSGVQKSLQNQNERQMGVIDCQKVSKQQIKELKNCLVLKNTEKIQLSRNG